MTQRFRDNTTARSIRCQGTSGVPVLALLRVPVLSLLLVKVPVLSLAFLLLAAPGHADIIHLESGGQIEGRILRQDDSSVTIEMGAGTMELPMSGVLRIEGGRTALDDYEDKLAGLSDDDTAGWLALGQWSDRHDLPNQAKAAYQHVLARDPGNAPANQALGRVNVDGRWLSADEAYAARGYVRFEGDWMKPEEKAAIEQERQLKAAERAEADARQAEARAQQAEARARQAEANAKAAQEEAENEPIYYWNRIPPQRPIRPPRPRPRG